MLKKSDKQVMVEEVKGKLSGASSLVLVDSRGLTVAQDTELRKQLRESGVDYKVYKNSVIKFAVEGTEFEGVKEYLSGPTAIAISYDDATAGARVINKQMKTSPKLEFKVGVIENTLYDSENIAKIAEIPPKDELIAKLLGSFKSPMSSFARLVNAISEKKNEDSGTAEA